MNQILQWGAVLGAVVGLAIYGKIMGKRERQHCIQERANRLKDSRQKEMFDERETEHREVAMAGSK
jgi:hypothetical protein